MLHNLPSEHWKLNQNHIRNRFLCKALSANRMGFSLKLNFGARSGVMSRFIDHIWLSVDQLSLTFRSGMRALSLAVKSHCTVTQASYSPFFIHLKTQILQPFLFNRGAANNPWLRLFITTAVAVATHTSRFYAIYYEHLRVKNLLHHKSPCPSLMWLAFCLLFSRLHRLKFLVLNTRREVIYTASVTQTDLESEYRGSALARISLH